MPEAEHAEMQPARRANMDGVSHASPPRPVSAARCNFFRTYCRRNWKARRSCSPPVFSTGASRRAEFSGNRVGFHDADPSGQDGRFDDGVLGAVEAEKVAQPSAVDHIRDDGCSFLAIVERLDSKGVPAAGVGEDHAVHRRSRLQAWQWFQLADGGVGEELDIIRYMQDSLAGLFEIPIGYRGAKRPQQQPFEIRVHDRSHRGDVRRAVRVERRDDSLQQFAVGKGGAGRMRRFRPSRQRQNVTGCAGRGGRWARGSTSSSSRQNLWFGIDGHVRPNAGNWPASRSHIRSVWIQGETALQIPATGSARTPSTLRPLSKPWVEGRTAIWLGRRPGNDIVPRRAGRALRKIIPVPSCRICDARP